MCSTGAYRLEAGSSIHRKKTTKNCFFVCFFPTINARNLIAHESSVKDITNGSVMFT